MLVDFADAAGVAQRVQNAIERLELPSLNSLASDFTKVDAGPHSVTALSLHCCIGGHCLVSVVDRDSGQRRSAHHRDLPSHWCACL